MLVLHFRSTCPPHNRRRHTNFSRNSLFLWSDQKNFSLLNFWHNETIKHHKCMAHKRFFFYLFVHSFLFFEAFCFLCWSLLVFFTGSCCCCNYVFFGTFWLCRAYTISVVGDNFSLVSFCHTCIIFPLKITFNRLVCLCCVWEKKKFDIDILKIFLFSLLLLLFDFELLLYVVDFFLSRMKYSLEFCSSLAQPIRKFSSIEIK